MPGVVRTTAFSSSHFKSVTIDPIVLCNYDYAHNLEDLVALLVKEGTRPLFMMEKNSSYENRQLSRIT